VFFFATFACFSFLSETAVTNSFSQEELSMLLLLQLLKVSSVYVVIDEVVVVAVTAGVVGGGGGVVVVGVVAVAVVDGVVAVVVVDGGVGVEGFCCLFSVICAVRCRQYGGSTGIGMSFAIYANLSASLVSS